MLYKLFKPNQLKPYQKIISKIPAKNHFDSLSDNTLVKSINKSINEKENAFAIIREAAKRTLNLSPYDVQLLGALIISDGNIAEMKTGEGKTLTAGISAVYNALLGHKVFVVTVNDYLAARDLHENKPLFDFFGLTSGLITSNNSDTEFKQSQYHCNIVYGTNSEFCFDYLRDNMVHDINEKVQPIQDYVLIDEIDSILIDEARTPLIISGQSDSFQYDLYMIDSFAKTLKEGEELLVDYQKTHTNDFFIDKQQGSVVLTEKAVEKIENYFKIDNLYENHNSSSLAHIIEQALVANHVFFEGLQYVIKDEKIVLIDENTGRLTEGRQLSNGLHQAIEAKEKLVLSSSSTVLAEITYQNYFKLFNKISGMTGTIINEEIEMSSIYGLDIIQVPTNKPTIREDKKDLLFIVKEAKINHLVKIVKEIHAQGRPILIGTASVTDNEILEEVFKKENIFVNVLNAKNAEIESEIIAKAGEFGAITLTTNMAGRGVDIKLDSKSKELGGLYVIGFERYDNRRIDNQLRGRSGRQGDPGTSQFLVSLDDKVIKNFAGTKLLNLISNLNIDSNEILESKMVSNGIEKAQKRIEEMHFESRKELIKYDQIISVQRNKLFELRNNILSLNYDFILKIDELIDVGVNGIFKYGEEDKELAAENLLSKFNMKIEDVSNLNKSSLKTIFTNTIANNFSAVSREDFIAIVRSVYLDILDGNWIDNLTNLEELRKGVGLRQINQKDPLIEFNKEAFSMYESMIANIQYNILKTLLNISITTDSI